MATEVKRLIQVRTEKGARFKRDGYGKKRQLSDSWRKPRGQHNKQREQKKAKGALPKPGFGSPVAVRGMHPSGFFEVMVATLNDLEGLDPRTQAVRIASTVGTRKRVAIQDKAITAGLRVLNAKVIKAARKPEKPAPVKKEAGEKSEKKPAKKAEKAPAKKAAAKPKAEKAEKKAEPEAKAEKKAPAKRAAAKPKADKAEKKAEPEAKAEKKAPAKKAAAKPKAEKAEKKAEPEAKAEKKAPAKKAAAKPKTEKGVKKNE